MTETVGAGQRVRDRHGQLFADRAHREAYVRGRCVFTRVGQCLPDDPIGRVRRQYGDPGDLRQVRLNPQPGGGGRLDELGQVVKAAGKGGILRRRVVGPQQHDHGSHLLQGGQAAGADGPQRRSVAFGVRRHRQGRAGVDRGGGQMGGDDVVEIPGHRRALGEDSLTRCPLGGEHAKHALLADVGRPPEWHEQQRRELQQNEDGDPELADCQAAHDAGGADHDEHHSRHRGPGPGGGELASREEQVEEDKIECDAPADRQIRDGHGGARPEREHRVAALAQHGEATGDQQHRMPPLGRGVQTIDLRGGPEIGEADEVEHQTHAEHPGRRRGVLQPRTAVPPLDESMSHSSRPHHPIPPRVARHAVHQRLYAPGCRTSFDRRGRRHAPRRMAEWTSRSWARSPYSP